MVLESINTFYTIISQVSSIANFGHFGSVIIFRILGVFWSSFFQTEQLWCGSRVVFRMFLTILIFKTKWRFCKGYSLCMDGGQFWPFWKRHFSNIICFLERLCSQNNSNVGLELLIFRIFSTILIFNPKWQFWPFWKCCHFSNIWCFLKRFFPQNNSNVVLEFFSAYFWQL